MQPRGAVGERVSARNKGAQRPRVESLGGGVGVADCGPGGRTYTAAGFTPNKRAVGLVIARRPTGPAYRLLQTYRLTDFVFGVTVEGFALLQKEVDRDTDQRVFRDAWRSCSLDAVEAAGLLGEVRVLVPAESGFLALERFVARLGGLLLVVALPRSAY